MSAERCPMCGRTVPSFFEHVDIPCGQIDEDLNDEDFEARAEEMRATPDEEK